MGAPVTRSSSQRIGDEAPGSFAVRLEEFQGPFDLLLSLIAKQQLDVTLVALHRVTDEFIAHIRALGDGWDLGQASEFLVVAATLLDLKAARLLPAGAEIEDEEDLARLEARDLLFARLLQYRAIREVARLFATRLAGEDRRHPRAAPLEPRFAALLPPTRLDLHPTRFAQLAARALTPRPPAKVLVEHVLAPSVDVREQARILTTRLQRSGSATFRGLTGDCAGTAEVVGRFLALLELYREGAVWFEQVSPFGELGVRWVTEPGRPVEPDRWSEEPTEPVESVATEPG